MHALLHTSRAVMYLSDSGPFRGILRALILRRDLHRSPGCSLGTQELFLHFGLSLSASSDLGELSRKVGTECPESWYAELSFSGLRLSPRSLIQDELCERSSQS